MGGLGCLLLDNLEDLFEARLTVGGGTYEETPAIKAPLGGLISRIGLNLHVSSGGATTHFDVSGILKTWKRQRGVQAPGTFGTQGVGRSRFPPPLARPDRSNLN